MHPDWTLSPHAHPSALGILPLFLSEADPRPAATQLHEAYAHGGGWQPFKGFTLGRPEADPLTWALEYPGDRPMEAVGFARLRDETVVLFEYSWVAIVAADGAWQVARMD